ncbi:hypothetical protein SI65_07996 [Aspergillus cristatus]|uniref:Enoyl reductase (ER) domain-containing protein n=1 Tax=Aspergillus cristatus TaxID=573508 RepID=A0A1E3B6D0_ASPCR|nr:hypothetical protein SI65_07996 [Aspergillus cristatus]
MARSIQQFVSNFDGLDGLKKVDAPMPSPGQGEVLVQIKTVSLNYRDMEVIRGEYTHDQSINQGSTIVPSSDMCGIIQSVGSGTTKWKVGDRVLSTFIPDIKLPRVLATHRVFPEHALIKAPEYMSDKEASTLTIAGITAWMGINGMRPLGQNGGKDEHILLQGTGGVSIAGLQLAKASGAKGGRSFTSLFHFLLFTDRKPKLSAQTSPSTTAKPPDWEKEVTKVTNGHGADIILEVGGSETLSKSFNCAAYNGLINCIGYTSGKAQAGGDQPNVNILAISKVLTLKGIIVGPTDRFEEIVRFVEKHEVHPVMCKTFSFEKAKDALKYLESGSHFGKVVIQVSS